MFGVCKLSVYFCEQECHNQGKSKINPFLRFPFASVFLHVIFFQANRNCIAIASSHDIQELDVSAILATQIYTWVDDDTEIENKGYIFFAFNITLDCA